MKNNREVYNYIQLAHFISIWMIKNRIKIDFGHLSIQIDNNIDVWVTEIMRNNRRETTTANQAASADESRIEINILLLAKTKVNFVIKWKIFIYLSKSIPSPPAIMHLFQRFFQSSKHLLNSISGISFKAFFDSACISSIVSKRCPRSGLLSLGNSQKSHGDRSGEYGGCGTICVEFLAKWSRRTSAVWVGALSWYKNDELSAQNIFWNGVEWSSWNANSISKVSNYYQSTIFEHQIFDFHDKLFIGWCFVSSGALFVFNAFLSFIEHFMSLRCSCFR